MKAAIFAALLAIWPASAVLAQEEAPPTPAEAAELAAKPLPPAQTGGAPLTASDVEAFTDGMVPVSLARGDIAGAVVVVVKDGQILFQKGYGVSDTKTRAPVDPQRTLFRPGSVSKLFTWTAVMQLVGAGKLDLDADVNRYLDFTIPAAFGKPITLRHLMTHTAGFEETYRPLLIGRPDGVDPLEKVMKESLPPRIYPPGEVPAYSNYGASLAGYIVQRMSGEKFETYVQRHIFAPLGMAHATFVQPLPASLAKDMSKGYPTASGPAVPFEMISLAPAGGLSASGADIGRFMIAHLNMGELDGQRILPAQIAVRMHGIALPMFKAISPMAYGFYHDDMNGHRVIGHDGDTGPFHSLLALILDANTGVYMSMNSAGIGGGASILRRAYMIGFMRRYFPPPPGEPVLPTLKTAHAHGQMIAGPYAFSRAGDTNFTHIFELFQPIWITLNADDTISANLLVNAAGGEKRWREVKPFVWEEVNGYGSRIEAVMRAGKVMMIGMDDIGPIAVLLPAGWTLGFWNFVLCVGALAILVLAVVFWPIKAILRWRYERPMTLTGRARWLYTLSRVVALIDIVFVLGFPLMFLYASSRLASMSPSIDYVLRALQLLGVIAVIGTAIPVANFAMGVADDARPWWTKGSDLLLVLAAVVVVWVAFSQHLLTLGLRY